MIRELSAKEILSLVPSLSPSALDFVADLASERESEARKSHGWALAGSSSEEAEWAEVWEAATD
tara:strand:- start:2341 stop:2532 length:192 start_codon:yes stop_codon:yes gene_type:complete